MKPTGLTILVAVIGLLGAAGLAFGIVEIQRLNGEIASLRGDVKRASDRADETAGAQDGGGAEESEAIAAREAEIERLTNKVAALESDLRSTEDRIDDVVASNGAAGDGSGAMSDGDPASVAAIREELDALAAEVQTMREQGAAMAQGMNQMREQMAQAQPGGEMPFEQMSEIVGLTPAQEDMLAEQILTHQQSLLDLITRPDENGKMIADDIIDVFFNPEATEGERGAAFMKLLATPVPGEDRTFGEMVGEMEGNLQSEFMQGLNDEQRQAYAQLRVHPKDLKLPNDPLDSWIMQRAQDRGYAVPGEGEGE